MILKRIHLICSAHHKRGDQVKEFNLSPFLFQKLTKFHIAYRNYTVNLISEGWFEVEGVYYLELNTSQGIVYVTDYIYTLR